MENGGILCNLVIRTLHTLHLSLFFVAAFSTQWVEAWPGCEGWEVQGLLQPFVSPEASFLRDPTTASLQEPPFWRRGGSEHQV